MVKRTMTPVSRGKQLAALRRKANLRQRDVAELLDVTSSAVSEWERGVSSPAWHRLRTLDDAYGAGGSLLAMFGEDNGISRYDTLSRRFDVVESRVTLLEQAQRNLVRILLQAQNIAAMQASLREQGGDRPRGSDHTDTNHPDHEGGGSVDYG